MASIEPVTPQSPPELADQVRELFRAYGEFLKTTGGHALFCFSGLEQEIAQLPAAYTEAQGEVLLARSGKIVDGCIAYRAYAPRPRCVEIKRLYVKPERRGRGVAKALIEAALQRATARGYQTACLDTEPSAMPSALHLYRSLGFVDDVERNTAAADGHALVVYLRRELSVEPISET